jgi:hydroxymethylglutaryl-CoA lyase
LPSLIFCALAVVLWIHGIPANSPALFHLPSKGVWNEILALQISVYQWVVRWNSTATLAATAFFVTTLLLPRWRNWTTLALIPYGLLLWPTSPCAGAELLLAMNSEVKIVECPRDAWQGLPKPIPAEIKADYLRTLVDAGFRHIDAVSFVSPQAVPQMADAEQVLGFLDPPANVEIIGIVVNQKGAARAIDTGAVATLGFPWSVSPTFLSRNQHQTPEEALDALEAVGQAAFQAGLGLVAYISMAFGNPYGDPWGLDEVVAACDLLTDSGITQISLADTVGVAQPQQIGDLVSAVLASVDERTDVGVHMHSRPEDTAVRIAAAYNAGCRRFDMAIGGYGGCPFAQDALVGNIPTGLALAELQRLGASLPRLQHLDTLRIAAAEIERSFGHLVQ